MTPSFLDHLIAFTLLAVIPLLARWNYPRHRARIRANPGARLSLYRSTIAQQWLFVAFVLAVWFALGRGCAALGLVVPSGIRTYIGLAVTAAGLALLRVQLVLVRRGGEEALAAVRGQLTAVEEIMPRTGTEMRWFGAMSVTAGICEELLYRGFLIAYLAVLLGTWPAVVAGAVIFAFGHLYQGVTNAAKSAVFALLAGVLYVACGSLLWPMILHAALDLTGGTLGRMALGNRRA
jgi:membrane protease YdiL (CAAX protease family)